ncbi:MAG TPA: hypothetical protein VIV11_19555 [Kofleriaceae bacterium]
MGFDPRSGGGQHLAHGEIIELAQIQLARPSDPSDSISLALFHGADPSPAPCVDATDVVCGLHLQGSATFTALPSTNPPLLGWRDDPTALGPGSLQVSLSLFGEVMTLDLIGARARLDSVEMPRGSIGGGLRRADVESKIVPAFVQALEQMLAMQCHDREPPTCACTDTLVDADDWLRWFDIDPKDCTITSQEVLKSAVGSNYIFYDVTIDSETLMSFGFGFEAVPAAW